PEPEGRPRRPSNLEQAKVVSSAATVPPTGRQPETRRSAGRHGTPKGNGTPPQHRLLATLPAASRPGLQATPPPTHARLWSLAFVTLALKASRSATCTERKVKHGRTSQ